MRLQKYLSACGVCSRRQAEEYISAGRVTVNGRVASLGESVDGEADAVAVDGKPVALPAEHTYIMLHKPRGYVTTLRDPQGRPTAAELVADAGIRLYPVGRLDLQSEGLLLFTDDGETANRLAHPSYRVPKTYRVWVRGNDPVTCAEALRGPVTYRGVEYRAAEVDVVRTYRHRAVLDLTVREGKNREVRNMCAAVGMQVERLLRRSQGAISLGDLPAGKWRYLTREEVAFLQSLQ